MIPVTHRCPRVAACWAATALWAALAFGSPLAAQDHRPAPPAPVPNLASLDIEELARIRVTSAARKPEPVALTTAAITVVTREDIRRSGAASLPEALRLVPGLEVARVGTRDWAISARGFNQQSSNKLLLLVDGRTVYSPIFAGVFWDAVAIPFDEIDRIEVIRGPGATLWGANAVNGVINVITRPAAESQGGRITTGGGTSDRLGIGMRFGGRLGEHTAARINLSAGQRDLAVLSDGSDAFDDWRLGQVGFRVDGARSEANQWMLQGNAYLGGGGNRLMLPIPSAPYAELRDDDLRVSGGNLIARWTRRFSPTSELSVQADYDRTRREQTPLFGTMTVNFAELDLQHRFSLGTRHDLLWGLGYQLAVDEITGAPAISFDPDHRTTHRVGAFVQDEITLAPERLVLTLGSKISYNTYSALELQPNARLLWSLPQRQTVWGAVSRAVRTPSRIDADVHVEAALLDAPVEARVVGSESFVSEQLLAYELGYRVEPHVRLAVDVALFYNDYAKLRTLTPQPPVPASPRPIQSFLVANNAHGRSYGAEGSVTVRGAPWWRLRGMYAYLQMRTAPDADAPSGSLVDATPADNPQHQASLWSSIDVASGGELDLGVRYVSELEGQGVPSYLTADLRTGWRWGRRVELSFMVQDLLHDRHAEFPTAAFVADARFIERRAYARMTWRF